MNLNDNQKLVEGLNDSGIREAEEDWISELPDEILHHIISFLELKLVVRTCVLSKRWNDIWTSIPILKFPKWGHPETPSLSEINKFMDFMDRTLILRDASSSNLHKVYLRTHKHMNESRVHSWISSITKHNIKLLVVCLRLDKPISIPSSLFKCESLTYLLLSSSHVIHIPKSFSFPRLKILELFHIEFTDDCCNEQQFSDCPVLQKLVLGNCKWFGVRKFCIVTPALKVLKIVNQICEEDGLRDCELKIHAPDLESLIYMDVVAKDYEISSFVNLHDSEIDFLKYDADERTVHGAAVRKFLQALSHVKRGAFHLEAALVGDDFVNILPRFHNLKELDLMIGPATDKLISALLKAAPNLKKLGFDADVFSSEDGHNGDADRVYDETEDLFQHLKSVRFRGVVGEGRELQWAKLILKKAKYLQSMTIKQDTDYYETKEVVMSELLSLARRASGRCVIKFV